MKHVFTLIAVFLFISFASAQKPADFTNFSMGESSGSVFTTNNFKAINVGRDGVIWAGSQYGGLYRYDTATKAWAKSSQLTNVFINDIKMDRDSGIWIGQSGIQGGGTATNIAGGVNYFPESDDSKMEFYSIAGTTTLADLWSRNVRSLYIDTAYPGQTPRVWAAQGLSRSAGNAIMGGLSIGLNSTTPYFSRQTDHLDTRNIPTAEGIGGDKEEVWMGIRNNFRATQIHRYTPDGQFLGFYDHTNLPKVFPEAYFIQSIFFDSHGNKWIAMRSGGLIVKTPNGWGKIPDNWLLPDGGMFNVNAVCEDEYGNVYFGTSKGLVKFKSPRYNASFDPTFLGNWERYTTLQGMVGDEVHGLAYDKGLHYLLIATNNGISFLNLKEPHIKGVAFNVYTGLDVDSVAGFKKIPVEAVAYLIYDDEVKETVRADKDGIFELKTSQENKAYTVKVEYTPPRTSDLPKFTYLYNNVRKHTRLTPALFPDSLIREMTTFKEKMRKKCVTWNFPLTSLPAIDFCINGFDTANYSKPFHKFFNEDGITDHAIRVENLGDYFATLKTVYELGDKATDLTIEGVDNLWQLIDVLKGLVSFGKGITTNIQRLPDSLKSMATDAAVSSLVKGTLNTVVGSAKKLMEYMASDYTKDPKQKKVFDGFITTFNDVLDLLIEYQAEGMSKDAAESKLFFDQVKKISSIKLGEFMYRYHYAQSVHKDLINLTSLGASNKVSQKPYLDVYNSLINYNDTVSVMKKSIDDYKWTKDAVKNLNWIVNVSGNISDLASGAAALGFAFGPVTVPVIKTIGWLAKGIQLVGACTVVYIDGTGVFKQIDLSTAVQDKAGLKMHPHTRGHGEGARVASIAQLLNELNQLKDGLENLRTAVNSPTFVDENVGNGILGYIKYDSIYSLGYHNAILEIKSAYNHASTDIPDFAQKFKRLNEDFVGPLQSIKQGFAFQMAAFAMDSDSHDYAPSVDSTILQMKALNDSIYQTIASLIGDIDDNNISAPAFLYLKSRNMNHTHIPGSAGTVTYTFRNYGRENMNNVRIKVTEPTNDFVITSADSIVIGNIAPGEDKIVNFQFASPAATDSITFGQFDVKVFADNGTFNDEVGTLYIINQRTVPVVLQNVSITCSGDNNILTWQTASESNSSHFDIEASKNGVNWSAVGTVFAVGNSSTTRNYLFNYKAGEYQFYRLKQVDKDGKFSFSEVVRSPCKASAPVVSVYPVPASSVLHVDLTSEKAGVVSLIIADLTGRQIKRKDVRVDTGKNKLQLPTVGLSNGQYILRIESGWMSKSVKISVQR